MACSARGIIPGCFRASLCHLPPFVPHPARLGLLRRPPQFAQRVDLHLPGTLWPNSASRRNLRERAGVFVVQGPHPNVRRFNRDRSPSIFMQPPPVSNRGGRIGPGTDVLLLALCAPRYAASRSALAPEPHRARRTAPRPSRPATTRTPALE